MNGRQQKFCYEYVSNNHNIVQAALAAGYSETYANKLAYKLLENIGVQDEISRLEEPIKKALEEAAVSKAIADQQEVAETLTKIMRREMPEIGYTMEGIEIEKPTSIKDVIKASELMGKMYGMFQDKLAVESEVTGVVMLPEVEEETRG